MTAITDQMLSIARTHVWQLALLASAVLVVGFIANKRHPHLMYLLWMLVLLKAMVPPIWFSPTAVFGKLNSRAEGVSVGDTIETVSERSGEPIMGTPRVDVMGTSEEAAGISAATDFSFSLWAVAVWATGSVLLLAFFIRNHWMFCRGLLRESLTDHRLQSLAENLAQTVGLKRTPRVLLSPSEFGPSAFGVFRYMLVLPKSTSQRGNVSELEPVIAHELVHFRRCDPLAAWLQLAAVCLNWWNPLVWWSSRAATRSREKCCDREVLGSFKYPPERYAQALIDVLRNQLQRPVPLVIAALPLTQDRIENIMLRHNSLLAKSPRWCWVVILLLAAAVLPAGPPPTDKQASDPKPAISETAKATEKQAMDTPKLIYLAWSQPKPKDKNAKPRQLWTPDGRIVSETDVSENIAKRLHVSTHEQEGYPQLECLTLIFDVDDRLTYSPIFPTVPSAGKLGTRWSTVNTEKDEKGLAFTSMTLLKSKFEKWPERISMEINYPTENLTVIQTIKEIPDEPVKIAEGITWYLDESRAVDYSDPNGPRRVTDKSAAVLQSRHDRPDQLTAYSVRVYLKHEEKPLRGAYTTIIEPDGQRHTIDVSDPVDPEEIERIEVIRQRRESRLIKDIPIKVELMPQPE